MIDIKVPLQIKIAQYIRDELDFFISKLGTESGILRSNYGEKATISTINQGWTRFYVYQETCRQQVQKTKKFFWLKPEETTNTQYFYNPVCEITINENYVSIQITGTKHNKTVQQIAAQIQEKFKVNVTITMISE